MISKIGVGLVVLGGVILFVEAILTLNNIWYTFLLISLVCLVVGVALVTSEENKKAEKEEKKGEE